MKSTEDQEERSIRIVRIRGKTIEATALQETTISEIKKATALTATPITTIREGAIPTAQVVAPLETTIPTVRAVAPLEVTTRTDLIEALAVVLVVATTLVEVLLRVAPPVVALQEIALVDVKSQDTLNSMERASHYILDTGVCSFHGLS